MIVADGAESALGNLSHTVFKGEIRNGVDSFFVPGGNPGVGMQVPVPAFAKIKAGGNLNGMTMAWMGISMKPDVFLKLALANKLEFRIGGTSLPLNERQIEIVHNLAKQITLP